MVGHLHQFRGKHAGGAVIGGKGFVQLRHVPAKGMGFIEKIDIKTGIGQIQSTLDAANAPADNDDFSASFMSIRLHALNSYNELYGTRCS
jgi:hypothetical protein